MRQLEAPIAGKTQGIRCSQSIRFAHGLGPAHGASFSKAIAKIGKAYRILLSPLACVPAGDAELAYFNKQMLIHELIRGSLTLDFLRPGRGFTDDFINIQVAEFEIL